MSIALVAYATTLVSLPDIPSGIDVVLPTPTGGEHLWQAGPRVPADWGIAPDGLDEAAADSALDAMGFARTSDWQRVGRQYRAVVVGITAPERHEQRGDQ